MFKKQDQKWTDSISTLKFKINWFHSEFSDADARFLKQKTRIEASANSQQVR